MAYSAFMTTMSLTVRYRSKTKALAEEFRVTTPFTANASRSHGNTTNGDLRSCTEAQGESLPSSPNLLR